LGQRRLAEMVIDRTIDHRVGRDATAGLGDGLHVFLCGTGSPLPDPTRAGPCTAIIAGKHIFIVDAGDGAARTLLLAGLPIGHVDRLFLTHFHSDHIDGLGALMLLRWTGGSATAPLPVSGPPGVEQVVAGFNAAYALDSGYRTAHHGPKVAPPSGAGGIAQPFPVPGAGATVATLDGVRVTAFSVDHGPVRPAVGYRFDYKGRSVVVSGDTRPTPVLVQAARGADLLVHEALQPRIVARMGAALAAHGQANTAQIMHDIPGYHTTPEQAADAARAAGVRALVLTHIVPPMPTRFAYPAFLGEASAHFDGPITIGEDGMVFSLPTGSTAINRKQLL
ncbi:MAG: MBL fold metallo-hydrolase, partial [Sphingomonas sp.]